MNEKIELGDSAQDIVTGFKGTVVAITEWITGCRRISLQPALDKDGDIRENSTFDEPMIKIVKKAKKEITDARGIIKKKPVSRGGPRPDVSKY